MKNLKSNLTLVLSLIALITYAQIPTFEKGKSSITIQAGPLISLLRGNAAIDNTNQNQRKKKIGYAVGLLLDKQFNEKIGFSTGLLYERKGGLSLTDATYYDDVEQVTKQGEIEFEYKYDYFTLPLFLTYKIKNTNLTIGVGGFVGYLHKQVRIRNPLFPSSGVSFFDETDLNTKLDLGVALKIQYKIELDEHKYLTLQVLNTLGLLNIRRDLLDNQTMKTNAYSFLIGVNLN